MIDCSNPRMTQDLVHMPLRIQRRRVKGWRMPENTVSVCRPGKWGNPFVVSADKKRLAHYADYKKNVDGWSGWPVADAITAVKAFKWLNRHKYTCEQIATQLRGKNLACYCKLSEPCHADVLLEIANK